MISTLLFCCCYNAFPFSILAFIAPEPGSAQPNKSSPPPLPLVLVLGGGSSSGDGGGDTGTVLDHNLVTTLVDRVDLSSNSSSNSSNRSSGRGRKGVAGTGAAEAEATVPWLLRSNCGEMEGRRETK